MKVLNEDKNNKSHSYTKSGDINDVGQVHSDD